MMERSQKPGAGNQNDAVVSAPRGRERIAQGEALGSSSHWSSKPQRGGIALAMVLGLMVISMRPIQADDTPQFRKIRIGDGRVFVSIPSTWKTQEFAQLQTAVMPPHLKGVGIIFSASFDPLHPEPATGANYVRKWAAQVKAPVTEQADRVYFSTSEPYEFEGQKGMVYAFGVGVDRAAVRIQVRMPDQWKSTDAGKRILTENMPEFIKNLHLDRPRGDKAVERFETNVADGKDRSFSIASNDIEINAAKAKAQETLGEFREVLQKTEDVRKFLIKAAISRGNKTDYTWISNLKVTSAGFDGIVASDSSRPEFPKKGDAITVKNIDVADWVYSKNDKLVGGFTNRIIQERLKAKENSK